MVQASENLALMLIINSTKDIYFENQNGAFDELIYWTRSLSDSEIDYLYNGGKGHVPL